MNDAPSLPSSSAKAVHRQLGLLAGGLWLVVSVQLFTALGHEIAGHGWHAVAMVAAPPLIPLTLLVLVLFFGTPPVALLVAVGIAAWLGVPWWLAARQPQSRLLLWGARLAIVSYFSLAWFGISLSA